MEFGKGKLKRNGYDFLRNAVHSRHGIAWTDGTVVYLTRINFSNNELTASTSSQKTVGTFQLVRSVQWCSYSQGTVDDLLCIVHESDVTIWQTSERNSNLLFGQIRSIKSIPLARGVLWNTICDVLCLLTKDQVSLYFDHSQSLVSSENCLILPFRIDFESISCGCWSNDGNKLFIGVGREFVVFEWSDITSSINDYRFVSRTALPRLYGPICSMVLVSEATVACTSEVSLNQLCRVKNDEDFFCLPSGDLNSHSDGADTVSAQLLIVDVVKVELLDSVTIIGILSPDLLCVISNQSEIVVGSNVSHILFRFGLRQRNLTAMSNIVLPSVERPKGLHCIDGDHLLLMTGEDKPSVSIVIPTTSTVEYQLRLRLLSNLHDKSVLGVPEKCEPLSCAAVVTSQSYLSRKTNNDIQSTIYQLNSLPKLCLPNKPQNASKLITQLPDLQLGQAIGNEDAELQLELADFKTTPVCFSNSIERLINNMRSSTVTGENCWQQSSKNCERNESGLELSRGMGFPEALGRPAAPSVVHDHLAADDLKSSLCACGRIAHLNCQLISQLQQLELNFAKQMEIIHRLEHEVKSLMLCSNSEHDVYKSASHPDVVRLCMRQQNQNIDSRSPEVYAPNSQMFVLNNGHLQLSVIRDAFNLKTVQLWVGDTICTLGTDERGYIPLTFDSDQTYFITGF